jgi:cellulose synthase/poly-beta-1,6-N-acetylglucosamine synthase-like glycosyltransferase
VENNREDISRLIREMAIENSSKKILVQDVCFLVRVYNEEQVLAETIDKLISEKNADILIVNDGSSDNSRKILT